MKTISSATKKARNWDLIREILIHTVEGDLPSFYNEQAAISEEVAAYHLIILQEGGYMKKIGIQNSINGDVHLFNLRCAELTWKGNDLLDSIKNDDVWNKVKSKLADFGGTCSISVLVELATSISKSLLGLQ